MPMASSKSSNSIMEGNDFTKSGLLLVEKKVRNLEKRKLKLDAYKKQMDDGKKLNEDQMRAIANLAVVEMNLEMAKDLHKQFQQLYAEHQKQMKKQARREQVASQAAQHNSDVAKVTEVLELQSLMDNLSEDVRADFINGTNRAAVVTEEELNQIDKFYKLITPDDEGDEKMSQQIKDASEHIVSFLDKSSTAVADTTYKALHELVSRIKKCGYFEPDKTSDEAGNEEEEEEEDSSRASTPNGELSAGSGEEAQENAAQPQETPRESTPPEVPSDQKDQETIPSQDIPQEVAPPAVADVTAVTANEHGLNFLGDSEIEKAANPPENNVPVAQGVSDWAEEVENGQHPGEAETGNETAQSATNGFGHRGARGGGRGGGYRGNFNRRGGGERGGPRRGGRGGFGPSRGGGFQDGDGYRRGGRGGGRGFSRGGGQRGARRGGPPPQ